jgi:heat shock protein HslJ
MKSISFLVCLLFLLVFSFCSSTEPDGKDAEEKNFLNTIWVLESFEENGVTINLPSTQVYNVLFSSDSTFTGQSDCNEIGGKYRIVGNNQIEIIEIGTTKVYCGEDSKGNDFTSAISESHSFDVNDSKMFLLYSVDNSKMTFITK